MSRIGRRCCCCVSLLPLLAVALLYDAWQQGWLQSFTVPLTVSKEQLQQQIPKRYRSVLKQAIGELARSQMTTVPLYKLNATDPRARLARSVLRSVHVEQGQLKIEVGLPR